MRRMFSSLALLVAIKLACGASAIAPPKTYAAMLRPCGLHVRPVTVRLGARGETRVKLYAMHARIGRDPVALGARRDRVVTARTLKRTTRELQRVQGQVAYVVGET